MNDKGYKCPKCGYLNKPDASECLQCGIIFEKYIQNLGKKRKQFEPLLQQAIDALNNEKVENAGRILKSLKIKYPEFSEEINFLLAKTQTRIFQETPDKWIMNTNQKIILITMVLVISGMFLYPPFNLIAKNGTVLNMGYAWIFEPPRRGYLVANVNTAMLLIQWIGVIVVGGLIFVLSKSPSKRSESSSIAFEQSGNDYQGRKTETYTFDPQSIDEPTNRRQEKGPYPWKTVLIWTNVVFIAGFFVARPPQGVEGEAALAIKLLVALVYAIIGGVIIGIFKFFSRPKIQPDINQIQEQKNHSALQVHQQRPNQEENVTVKCPLCHNSMLKSEGRYSKDFKSVKICDSCFQKRNKDAKMSSCALCRRQTPEDDLLKYMAVKICPECYNFKNSH